MIKPGRLGIAVAGVLKDLNRGAERAVQKQFASPIEQVALAGVDVRGGFVFIGRLDELSVFFLYLAQQIV